MARNVEAPASASVRASKRPITAISTLQSLPHRTSAAKSRPNLSSDVESSPNHEESSRSTGGPNIPAPLGETSTLDAHLIMPSWSKPKGWAGMANELLLRILDHIEEDPPQVIRFDRRAYLSQESFKSPPQPSPTRAQDLGNFRRTCRHFSEIGVVHQFADVTTRFSKHDFARLNLIAEQPHLAKAVKKFSYMVPYFYVEGTNRSHTLAAINQNQRNLDTQVYLDRINDQSDILNTGLDQRTLNKALTAFQELQHVRILPLQDFHDRALLSYLRKFPDLAQFVDLNWARACSHSTRAMSEALVRARSPCSRFSSPHLTTQSALRLAQPGQPPRMGILASLVAQLSVVEIHFDDGSDELDDGMKRLSPLLRKAFQSAPLLQAVHVGFPVLRPISKVRLEEVFGDVDWPRLSCFGIQGWKLDGKEIEALVHKYRYTLKGLRLREVLLKEGSRWKDVLPYIRTTTRKLEWCSLRRIGYVPLDGDQSTWAEMSDDLFDDYASDSSDDYDNYHGDQSSNGDDEAYDHDVDTPGTSVVAGPSNTGGPSNIGNGGQVNPAYGSAAAPSDGYDSDEVSVVGSVRSHSDDENGGPEHTMEFSSRLLDPDSNGHATPNTPSSVLFCSCSDHLLDLEYGEYGDNGQTVPHMTRKVWEKWVIGRCLIHEASS